jgi:lipoyl-dependent peroxiredoxin
LCAHDGWWSRGTAAERVEGQIATSRTPPVNRNGSPLRPDSAVPVRSLAPATLERQSGFVPGSRLPSDLERDEDMMTIALRQAHVVWDGALASGAGAVSSGSGALELPVTWAARTEQPDGKTSPEELIAAAHGSCFAMALALVLGENHTPPERLTVTAACSLEEVDGAPRITTSELTVRARVPSLDEAGLDRVVARAADLCPVSNALRGNVEIIVHHAVDAD